MKKLTKTFATIALIASVFTGTYLTGKWSSQDNARVETTQSTEQVLKVDDKTAVTKNVTEPSEETTETTTTQSTENTAKTSKSEMTMDNAESYATAMTVSADSIGVGIGGVGFKDGTYFQVVGGEKVGISGMSFYVLSHASGDCIKVTCTSDMYQKAYGFAEYMNELAPNGKTNNGLKSNFDYFMNN